MNKLPPLDTPEPRVSVLLQAAHSARLRRLPFVVPSGVSSNKGRRVQVVDELPIERRLRERIEVLGPGVRALLLSVLRLPDERRAARIGELWADERTRLFAELLIDVEEDILVQAFVIAELKRARV